MTTVAAKTFWHGRMKSVLDVLRAARTGPWRRGWRRLLRAVGLMGAGISAATLSPAQPLAHLNVPQHWIRYANLAGQQLQDALSDSTNERVLRLHAWGRASLLRDGQVASAPPLVVRVWVGTNGKLERVVFDPVDDVQADEDLRAVLMTHRLSEPPPRDMRQPMVLQLTLGVSTQN